MATTNGASTFSFKIDGMHCGSCALLIDDVLQDLPGVHCTRTSVKQGHTVVELDTRLTSSEDVISAIGELGYQARPLL